MTSLTHAIILDFESTCDDQIQIQPQEIIEFPSVVLSLETLQITEEFESFVRPQHHSRLTRFCQELTSITQDQVDQAEVFRKVFSAHQQWLTENGLTPDNALFVTCGDWDLNIMLPAQCTASVPNIEHLPPVYRRWHNIKRSFCKVLGQEKAPGMAGMMKALELELVGHHHRGIDDCRNIATILCALIARGAAIEPTRKLAINRHPPVRLQLRLDSETREMVLEKRNVTALKGAFGRLFHRQVAGIFLSDGTEVTQDQQLLELMPGETIEGRAT